MKDLLALLAANKRYWLPPIVVFALVVAYLAWKAAQNPSEAFDYRAN